MTFSLKDPSKDSGVKVKLKNTESTKISNENDKSKPVSSINSKVEKIEVSEKVDKEKSSRKINDNNKNVFLAVGIGVIVIFSSIIYVVNSNSNSKLKREQIELQSEEQTTEAALSDEEKLQAELNSEGYGIGSVTKDTKTSNQTIVQSDTFVKDLDGQDIPEMFEVKAITYISDFVTYTKHRAVTGDGIELYWLDGKYKGQSCRVTMPYKYFKEIPDEGAVICKVEIIQTKEGNKIATWFQFDPDSYNKLIKKVGG